MNYRVLGRTGLNIIEFSLGTVELGLDYGIPDGRHMQPSAADASTLLNHALNQGINLIETARTYGSAEYVIGNAISKRRSEYYLCSKVPVSALETHGPLLEKYIYNSVRESLRALQTDYLDILLLHNATVFDLRNAQLMDALGKMLDLDLVHFIGVSVYDVETANLAIAQGICDIIEIPYNVLDRKWESSTLSLARQYNIGVIARSVLLRGLLAKPTPDFPVEMSRLKYALMNVANLSDGTGTRVVNLAYQYVLRNASVSSALIGTAYIDELDMILKDTPNDAIRADILTSLQCISVPDALLDPRQWPRGV